MRRPASLSSWAIITLSFFALLIFISRDPVPIRKLNRTDKSSALPTIVANNDLVLPPPIGDDEAASDSALARSFMTEPAFQPLQRIVTQRLPTREQVLERTKHITDYKTRHKCIAIMTGESVHGFASQYDQDWFVYRNFAAAHFDEPGVYLDIGANDPITLSNTLFFDQCLGWKGVCVEPNPEYIEGFKKHRTCRHLVNCVSNVNMQVVGFSFAKAYGGINAKSTQNATCVTLEHILKTNADILGEPDERGAWGTRLNYVSLDVEGHEPPIVCCSDLAGLLSSKPNYQVWTVESLHLAANILRGLDAAFGLAGFAKLAPLFRSDSTFSDDAYVMLRPRPLFPKFARCRDGNATCSLAGVMKAHRVASTGGGAMPILCPGALERF